MTFRPALALSLVLLSHLVHGANAAYVIGAVTARPPWTDVGPDGSPFGFEVELVGELCERIAVKCRLRPIEASDLSKMLSSGTLDAAIGGIPAGPKASDGLSHSIPYALSPETFATRRRNSLLSLPTLDRLDLDFLGREEEECLRSLDHALRDVRVGIEADSARRAFLQRYMPDLSRIHTYPSVADLLRVSKEGRLDVILANAPSLLASLGNTRKGDIVIFGPMMAGGPFGRGLGIAFSRANDPVRRKLDDAIRLALADGLIARLSLKWFGYNIMPHSHETTP